ncbi:unnamed protein product, partial [Owenia fusiformis]
PGYSSLYWKDCLHGGYRDPNDCPVCRCPDGWSGDMCDVISPPILESCGGEIDVTTTEEFLSNPDYGTGPYTKDSACTWLLKAPPGSQVQVRFVDAFGIDHSVGDVCSMDWVEVRYASPNYVGPRFCGSEAPSAVIDSMYGQMMVLFRTNARSESDTPSFDTGFKLGYKLIEGSNVEDIPKLELSGIGICPNQKWREGIYIIRESIRYNGYPVYKHMAESEFLYFKNNAWVVGPEIGGDDIGIKVNRETGNLECFDGDQWVEEGNLALEESQLCNTIWASGLDNTGENAALNGMYTRGEDGVYTNVEDTTISVYKEGVGWIINTSAGQLTYDFGSTEIDLTLIPNTWTVGTENVKFECYFGPKPCARLFLDGSDSDFRRGNMGFYRLEGSLHQKYPLYVHEFGERFLYRAVVDTTSKFWAMGKGLTSFTREMRVSTSALVPSDISPTEKWEETVDWQNWIEKDVTLQCVEPSDKQPPCDEIFLSINGDSGDVPQKGRLGLYKLQVDEYKNRPVYATIGNTNFLYYTEYGDWYIGTMIGSDSRGVTFKQSVVYPQELTVTPEGFGANGWAPMTGVGFTCLKRSSTCESIGVTSSASSFEGTWSKTSELNDERPAYKHDNANFYMYYLATYKRWNIGQKIGDTSIYALASSIAMSPTDIVPTWERFGASGWEEDSKFRVICLDPTTTTTT